MSRDLQLIKGEARDHLAELLARSDAALPAWTALHASVASGDFGAVRSLIEAGADVNAKSSDGYGPLHVACDNGFAEITRLLLDAGADPRQADPFGGTPIFCAAAAGRVDVVRVLLEHGVEVDAIVGFGRTALHWASAHNHTDLVGYLLNQGATVDVPDEQAQNTPLHLACRERAIDAALQLVAAGADPQRGNGEGKTPIQLDRSGRVVRHLRAMRAAADIKSVFDTLAARDPVAMKLGQPPVLAPSL